MSCYGSRQTMMLPSSISPCHVGANLFHSHLILISSGSQWELRVIILGRPSLLVLLLSTTSMWLSDVINWDYTLNTTARFSSCLHRHRLMNGDLTAFHSFQAASSDRVMIMDQHCGFFVAGVCHSAVTVTHSSLALGQCMSRLPFSSNSYPQQPCPRSVHECVA